MKTEKRHNQASVISQALILFFLIAATTAFALPEPGPDNGGLRLRFVVLPHPVKNDGLFVGVPRREGYDIYVDLINATNRDITWHLHEQYGSRDVKDLLEGAVSIETDPAVAPWSGQVADSHPPELEYVLKAGETLSVDWRTIGRHLKNNVYDPLVVQSPEFPFPGLYSVHATLRINTGEREVTLRSNEQLVPIGGSRDVPKSTYGKLTQVVEDTKTATLNLGSKQKIERGDEFRIPTISLNLNWKLTITQVASKYSIGHFEPLGCVITPPSVSNYEARLHYKLYIFPKENSEAILMPKK